MDYRELISGFRKSQKSEYNRIITKYLAPIIYRHRATGVDVIYLNELNEVTKELRPSIVSLLKKYIDDQEIPVIDSSLNEDEETKFIQEFVRKKEEKAKQKEKDAMIKDERKYKKEKLKEIRKNLKKINNIEINIRPKDIIKCLNSYTKKNLVNEAIDLDMAYFIEKMYIKNDKERAMIVLDLLFNDKANFVEYNGLLLNNKVRKSKILGLPTKDVLSYYNILHTEKVELSDTKISIIKKFEKIFKSASEVTEKERCEFVENQVMSMMLRNVLNSYDNKKTD